MAVTFYPRRFQHNREFTVVIVADSGTDLNGYSIGTIVYRRGPKLKNWGFEPLELDPLNNNIAYTLVTASKLHSDVSAASAEAEDLEFANRDQFEVQDGSMTINMNNGATPLQPSETVRVSD